MKLYTELRATVGSHRVCRGRQWGPLYGRALIATVVPQHDLPGVRPAHNKVRVELGKTRGHDGRLWRRESGDTVTMVTTGPEVPLWESDSRTYVITQYYQSYENRVDKKPTLCYSIYRACYTSICYVQNSTILNVITTLVHLVNKLKPPQIAILQFLTK